MTQRASTSSSAPSASGARLAPLRARLPGALLAFSLVASCAFALASLRPTPAAACGWAPDEIDDLTTFDPRVLGGAELPGLYYDPFHSGFGPGCEDCSKKALLAEWAAFLGEAVPREIWERILYQSTLADLDALIFSAKGKKGARPVEWAPAIAKQVGPAKERVTAALYFVGFARRVEPLAQSAGPEAAPAPEAQPLEALVKSGDGALAGARDPFLQQRYAFQLLRLRFYRAPPKEALAFFDAHQQALRGPSAQLAARAHHYAAGAALRAGQRPRGLLELAKVYDAAPALAPLAARDFTPRDQAEWEAALALASAGDARTANALWTLVGLRHDALVGAERLLARDRGAEGVPLLLVRELGRVEEKKEPPQKLEALAVQAAQAPKASRPWVAALVAAHGAALRGDVAQARARTEAARLLARQGGGDAVRVSAQADATVALALFTGASADAAARDEAVTRAAPLPDTFDRKRALLARLRRSLASGSPRALAELLQPTSVDVDEKSLGPWRDPAFVREVAALVQAPRTALEKYAVQEARTTPADLGRELAFAHLWRGEFALAAAALAADQDPLPVEPFERYWRDFRGRAPGPTYAAFGRRLVELEQRAKRPGDDGASADLELGVALYNLTRHAPARAVLGPLHQYTGDTAVALSWLQRGYQQARDKELRAELAFHGAQADFAQQVFTKSGGDRWYDGPQPVPETWYARLAALDGTGYQQEALAECGSYQKWKVKQGR